MTCCPLIGEIFLEWRLYLLTGWLGDRIHWSVRTSYRRFLPYTRLFLSRPMIRRLKRENDSIQLVSGYGRGPKSCPSMIRMGWTIPTGMDSSIHVINTSPIKVQNASSCHKYNFRRKKKVRNVIHSSYYIYNIIKYNSKNFRFVVY